MSVFAKVSRAKRLGSSWTRKWISSRNHTEKLVGLDIGSGLVKLVQLASMNDRWQLQYCGVKPLPRTTSTTDTLEVGRGIENVIKELVCESGSDQTQVACALRGPAVIVKSIQVPAMTLAELEEHLELEIDQYISADACEIYWDYHIVSALDSNVSLPTMSVLLVAAKKEAVHQHTELIRRAGLNPIVVDVDSLALSNMYALNYGDQDEKGALLISISPSGLALIMMYEGHPRYIREVSIGGEWYDDLSEHVCFNDVDSKVVVKNGVCDPVPKEAFLDEVRLEVQQEVKKTIEFCWDTVLHHRPEALFLCGGYAELPGLAEGLAAETKLSVRLIDPFRKLERSPGLQDAECLQKVGHLVGVAVGLALRGREGR